TIVAPSDRLPPRSRRTKPPRKSESEVIDETPDEIASGSKRRGNLSVRPRSSFRFTSPPATALTFLVALGFLVSPRSGFLGIESGATASLAAQDSAPDAQETRSSGEEDAPPEPTGTEPAPSTVSPRNDDAARDDSADESSNRATPTTPEGDEPGRDQEPTDLPDTAAPPPRLPPTSRDATGRGGAEPVIPRRPKRDI